jgi:uncharacterized protein YciI
MPKTLTALVCLTAVVAVLTTLLAAETANPADSKTRPCYWVFLNKGAGRGKLAGMPKEQVSKMQSDHVGNLGVLYQQGRSVAAGPLGDDGFIRGTVVLTVATPEAVKDCFKADPFVQQDVLAVEAYRWLADPSKFQKSEEPFRVAKHTLAIVKKAKNFEPPKGELTSQTLLALLPALGPMAKSGELVVSGPLLDAGDLVGILLFVSADSTKIKAALEADPAVKSGRLAIELHPQFMGAGVLRKPESAGQ